MSYGGTYELVPNTYASKYYVVMEGNVSTKLGTTELIIDLRYHCVIYVINDEVAIFTNKSLNKLRVEVTVGNSKYCYYLGKPVVTNTEVISMSIKKA